MVRPLSGNAASAPRIGWGGVASSLRRYYVDEFQARQVADLSREIRVLDLGGAKILKRGQFDIDRYGFRVVYANLSPAKRPDVQADAARIPFRPCSFDLVVCSELLEHVPEPGAVLLEVHRVLRTGGRLLACIPFLYQIHGDPQDYGRYTETYWRERLASAGFSALTIERQGLYWSVLVDMIRAYVAEGLGNGRVWPGVVRRALGPGVGLAKRTAVWLDQRPRIRANPCLSSFTTGFGIAAVKVGAQGA